MSDEDDIDDEVWDAHLQIFRKPEKNRPVIPAELWALWNTRTGCWVPTIDESGGSEDPIMVLLSRRDAEEAARRQNKLYELACVPVRIK